METIKINQSEKRILAEESMMQHSTFTNCCLNKAVFNDVAMEDVKIQNANLSNLEIDGAQMGGAYIHNIGMPPEGHPAYNPLAEQAPLKFEDCNLIGTTINNCNLSDLNITDCKLNGMRINGILVTELLERFNPG